MKGKVVLSYWAAFNRALTGNAYCFSVSNTNKTSKPINLLYGLMPGDLAWKYKENEITWEEYTEEYLKLLETVPAKKDLDLVRTLLDSGRDVWLMCYEAEPPCHRFIIGDLLAKEGYEVIGYNG